MPQRVISALDAYLEAEHAYRDELAQFIAAGPEGRTGPRRDPGQCDFEQLAAYRRTMLQRWEAFNDVVDLRNRELEVTSLTD